MKPIDNTKVDTPRATHSWRWSSPIKSAVAFFYVKPVTKEELDLVLKGSAEDVARSNKVLQESDRLFSEIDAQLKKAERFSMYGPNKKL